MKKLFEEPWLDVISIKNIDVLTASPNEQDTESIVTDGNEVPFEP